MAPLATRVPTFSGLNPCIRRICLPRYLYSYWYEKDNSILFLLKSIIILKNWGGIIYLLLKSASLKRAEALRGHSDRRFRLRHRCIPMLDRFIPSFNLSKFFCKRKLSIHPPVKWKIVLDAVNCLPVVSRNSNPWLGEGTYWDTSESFVDRGE